MRLNREKIALLLAIIIFLAGLWAVIGGILSPVQNIVVPEARVSESTRKILAKKYRTFTDPSEASRNPFSFSEGWQRMESTPMAFPPIPGAARPTPLLWPGATAKEAGLLWQDRPPVESDEKAEGGS